MQNHIIRIIQGLLPRTPGTACRGFLGVRDLLKQIDKRKLYLLGRIIMGHRMFGRIKEYFSEDLYDGNGILIKKKKKKTGFIPDIIRVLRRYNILHYVEGYYDKEVLPNKSRWKSVVKLAIKEVHEIEWREKVMRNSQLKISSVSLKHFWEIVHLSKIRRIY